MCLYQKEEKKKIFVRRFREGAGIRKDEPGAKAMVYNTKRLKGFRKLVTTEKKYHE